MTETRTRASFCWLATLALATMTQAQDKPFARSLNPQTIAAYEKLGASCHLLAHMTEYGLHYSIGLPPTERSVPAISFGGQPQGDLPEVGVPFCLYFSHGALTEARLKQLANLKNLVALDVDGYAISDATARDVAAIKKLRALTLHNSQITGVGLKELAVLKDLNVLSLGHTGVTDAGMKELASLTNLNVVGIYSTKVTAAGLRELKHVKNLSTLCLDSNLLTDANVRALREVGLLHKLRQGSSTGGTRPKSAAEVHVLDMNYAPILDSGLKELTPLTNLTWLNLNNTKVTDAGLKELARFKKLTALHLNGTLVTDSGLQELEGLTNLTELDLQRTKVTAAGMAYLREALPKCRVQR